MRFRDLRHTPSPATPLCKASRRRWYPTSSASSAPEHDAALSPRQRETEAAVERIAAAITRALDNGEASASG